MTESEIVLGLPDYEITSKEWKGGEARLSARCTGPIACPKCGSTRLRDKGRYTRAVRHEDWGVRRTRLILEGHKWCCLDCGRYFRQRFPGIQPWQRATEAFQKMVYRQHLDGINRSRLGRREGIGAATVERYFRRGLKRQSAEWHPPECPQVLGIDEHFFTRRKGYATTLCDLKNHKVYDVVLGRSELSLETYFEHMEGKDQVRVVCMDLASNYRALVRHHFPNARIVADRFHVIRREVAANEAAVVTIGVLHAGTKENVIPDEALIKLNVRTFDKGVRKRVLAAIERIVDAEAAASGAAKKPEITPFDRYSLVTNDPEGH